MRLRPRVTGGGCWDRLEKRDGLSHHAGMKIVVAGASGMLGTALTPALRERGHEVIGLGRTGGAQVARWDPARGELDRAVMEGAGAVINLAGAGIAEGRWTAARRAEILNSRVQSTRILVETMASIEARPEVFVCASAAGFYGEGGECELTEEAPPGDTFLAQVCQRWEAGAREAVPLGIRVVMMRLGMILSAQGGALAKMLPVFRSRLGGPAGGGTQWVSWITLDDAVAAFVHAVEVKTVHGPVNTAAPGVVRNAEFARALGEVLVRPAVVPAPAPMLRLMFGQMADETILQSARLVPRGLQASGFTFAHPELRGALRSVVA